jgi:hypothetical protein
MIRPFTVLCFLLACASGLYLYQSKHRVQMLDRDIERTVHITEATRDQTRLLGAEWMLLNDPERLRSLADQFLALQTVKPTQFTTLADLDHRLPPVRSPDAPLEPVPEPDVMTPMVPPPMAQAKPAPLPVAAPSPAAAPAPASQTPVAQQTPRPAPAPQIAARERERKPAPERPASPPPIHLVAQSEPRPPSPVRGPLLAAAAPRPLPAQHFTAPIAPVVTTTQSGSALGMAGHDSLPPPRPIALSQPIDH